jgi:hypothetical protein
MRMHPVVLSVLIFMDPAFSQPPPSCPCQKVEKQPLAAWAASVVDASACPCRPPTRTLAAPLRRLTPRNCRRDQDLLDKHLAGAHRGAKRSSQAARPPGARRAGLEGFPRQGVNPRASKARTESRQP